MKRAEIKRKIKTDEGMTVSVSKITAIANQLSFAGPDYNDDEVSQIVGQILDNATAQPAGQPYRTDVRADLSEVQDDQKAGSELALSSQLQTMSAMVGRQFQQIDCGLTQVEKAGGKRLAHRILDIPSNTMVYAQQELVEQMSGSANMADTVLESFDFNDLGGLALGNFTPVGALSASH